ncbi:inositol-3-phosphate synthase [Rhizobium leguminosarum]|uniref:inositol-3-phosphate synthase n=1 Tax=Rhizobium leguminosarum TaxID=384 RepID=UPI001F2B7932|nr:inositol-3-phosphate synthase [Rhizobium leguminosarum]UIJ83181.1 inositol-3-phosphate synthase [Rhizobium leguminosarum]
MSTTNNLRLAVAGVGNNIAALIQGFAYYKNISDPSSWKGVARPYLGGIAATEIDVVAAFDIAPNKVGLPLEEAVFSPPNNYPKIDVDVGGTGVVVTLGGASIESPQDRESELGRVIRTLVDSGAEVLLYSLPCGRLEALHFYLEAALGAGVAFVNCTPDPAAGDPQFRERFVRAGLPLVGDDLASHLGSSIIHKQLLALLTERGLHLAGSYQLNLGGNSDFANLLQHNSEKHASKFRALGDTASDDGRVVIVPSAAHVPFLNDRKVGLINVTGIGWAGFEASIDVRLTVQDSSNAAGVIVDLVRVAKLLKDNPDDEQHKQVARQILKSPYL